MVAGADVDVVGADIVVDQRSYGVGLRYFLALQALTLEHVQEVGVATHVELAGALKPYTTVEHQAGQSAVDDGGAHL